MTVLVPSRERAWSDECSVTLDEPWLLVGFGAPVRACSWALVGGGLVDTRHVAWLEVRDRDLRPPVDPRELLLHGLRARGIEGAVGLMTSRRVSSYSAVSMTSGGVEARCIATVGLGNALRAGDPAGVAGRIGTINVLVHVDAVLSDAALLEANAIATEAKTAVVLEAGVRSRQSGRPATGTGTDCTVVTSARARSRTHARYSGKHTAIGAAIGAAVEAATGDGVATWLAENAR
jgi:adenosylcobinamide amidohydrolase